MYATILIDVQTGKPVDVLPDRSAKTFAAWLTAHPGVQVICRDRAGAYAEGARTGAPEAVQVADRWHLWHNLGQAVERTVATCRDALRPEPPTATPPAPNATSKARAAPRLADSPLAVRTRQRHHDIHQLIAAGLGVKAIARRLQLAIGTVRRFARAATPDTLLAVHHSRHRGLDEHADYLRGQLAAGNGNAVELHRLLQTRGYPGSCRTVREYVAELRRAPDQPIPPAVGKAATVREATCWIMTDPANLNTTDTQKLHTILARSPVLQALAGHVRTFATMMRHLRGHQLPAWIDAVLADDLPHLHSFVTGVRYDLDAVTAGLTLPYSSGKVEGAVNRVKTIKRQMYGRANFDLLRRRILLTR